MIWLKLVHIAAIALWSGALISLPALYVQRAHVDSTASLHRLQALVRFLYVNLLSPAAFIAIASGTALIFLRETFEPWFSVKLALVAAMTVIHVMTGQVVIRLFDEDEIYPVWRFTAVTLLTIAVVTSILTVVLAKPDLPALLPDAFVEPGALRRLIPWPQSLSEIMRPMP